MTYRVLCAYDQSAGAEKAFAMAVEIAKRFQGELHVVSVFEPAEASRGVKSEALLETARAQFADAFEALRQKCAVAGVVVDTAVLVGAPAQQILRRAEELKADHVVVGQRGKNSFERSTVGSVSLRLVTQGSGVTTVVR
jgi:nucleotide-binding universal stress UspA family protein